MRKDYDWQSLYGVENPKVGDAPEEVTVDLTDHLRYDQEPVKHLDGMTHTEAIEAMRLQVEKGGAK